MAAFFGFAGLLLSTFLCHLLRFSMAGRSTADMSEAAAAAYAEFRRVHRRHESHEPGSKAYDERQALFEARALQVASHNAQKKSWTLTLNKFADFKPHEKQVMLGYKRVGGHGHWSPQAASSFVQTSGAGLADVDVSILDKVVDWRLKMNFSNVVHDQGSCGSCWAHAAASALEAHAELVTGLTAELATQELIDCSPNPRHCGGTGGCHGATAEIAFELARSRGITMLKGYRGTEGVCPPAQSDALRIKSYVRLPENRATHLMYALAMHGPVVLSVDAANLFMYNNGVFSGCQPDTIVNHAVLGVGYGTCQKTGKDYWQIKNSWSQKWGENGYFRLERFIEDDAYCGTDNKPQDGVYCDKHPDSIRVCGMCGITSDSAYPIFHSKNSVSKKSVRNKIADLFSKVTKPISDGISKVQVVSVF